MTRRPLSPLPTPSLSTGDTEDPGVTLRVVGTTRRSGRHHREVGSLGRPTDRADSSVTRGGTRPHRRSRTFREEGGQGVVGVSGPTTTRFRRSVFGPRPLHRGHLDGVRVRPSSRPQTRRPPDSHTTYIDRPKVTRTRGTPITAPGVHLHRRSSHRRTASSGDVPQ